MDDACEATTASSFSTAHAGIAATPSARKRCWIRNVGTTSAFAFSARSAHSSSKKDACSTVLCALLFFRNATASPSGCCAVV